MDHWNDSNYGYSRHTSLYNNLFNNGDIKMDEKYLIVARSDVDKPYIYASYDSYIDALQMHYRLADDGINNQIVELEF